MKKNNVMVGLLILLLSACASSPKEGVNLHAVPENQKIYIKLDNDYILKFEDMLGISSTYKIKKGIYVSALFDQSGVFYTRPETETSFAQRAGFTTEYYPSFYFNTKTDKVFGVVDGLTQPSQLTGLDELQIHLISNGYGYRFPNITKSVAPDTNDFRSKMRQSSREEYLATYGYQGK